MKLCWPFSFAALQLALSLENPWSTNKPLTMVRTVQGGRGTCRVYLLVHLEVSSNVLGSSVEYFVWWRVVLMGAF